MRAAGTTTGWRRGHQAAAPVFVDRSGRRRRIAVLGGTVAAVVLVSTAVIMLAGFTGAGGTLLPGLPGIAGGTQAPGAAPPARAQSAAPHPTSPVPRPQIPAPARSGGASTGPGGATPAISPSPSATSHRTVPTQTPSHPGRK